MNRYTYIFIYIIVRAKRALFWYTLGWHTVSILIVPRFFKRPAGNGFKTYKAATEFRLPLTAHGISMATRGGRIEPPLLKPAGSRGHRLTRRLTPKSRRLSGRGRR